MRVPATHVAVVLPEYVEGILAGRKRVEVRLAKSRCLPWGRVSRGDTVYFKERGGPVRCAAVVKRVEQHEGLTPAKVRTLERRLGRAADAVGAVYWRQKRHARYGTLVWIEAVRRVRRGPPVPRLYGAAWVIVERRRAAAPGQRSARHEHAVTTSASR